jgi:peptidoglycan/xylan/chitin deacetylase (PgdA/CDA1 family)
MFRPIKRASFRLARSCGIVSALRDSRWRQARLLILCYHGISQADEHEWRPSLYMTAAHLRSRLEVLRDGGYAVLPLDEALRRLFGRDLPPRSVVLTFDDGCSDFYKVAYPLIREFGFPVTVYQSTYYSEYQKPVFNLACSYMLWKARNRTLEPEPILEIDREFSLATEEQRQTIVSALVALSARRNLSGEQKNELAERLAQSLGLDFPALFADRRLYLMSVAEIAELAAKGVDFQLHTHRHRLPQDRELFQAEIRENRKRLLAITGKKPLHFCYPLGSHEQQFLPWLAEDSVISAVTCDPDLARPETGAFLLPRFVDTSGSSHSDFESWLSGFASLWPRRR